MNTFPWVAPLLLAASLSHAGNIADAPAEHLTFVKILSEGRPASNLAPGIDCTPVSGPGGPDELCVDWRVAIRIPFGSVQGVTIERERLSRELENMRRWLEGEPELPPGDATVAHGTVLTLRFSDEAAAALDTFVQRHRGELLDLRVGKERIDAFAFKSPRVTSVLRLSFAHDRTERFRQLFAPLGARVTVR